MKILAGVLYLLFPLTVMAQALPEDLSGVYELVFEYNLDDCSPRVRVTIDPYSQTRIVNISPLVKKNTPGSEYKRFEFGPSRTVDTQLNKKDTEWKDTCCGNVHEVVSHRYGYSKGYAESEYYSGTRAHALDLRSWFTNERLQYEETRIIFGREKDGLATTLEIEDYLNASYPVGQLFYCSYKKVQ